MPTHLAVFLLGGAALGLIALSTLRRASSSARKLPAPLKHDNPPEAIEQERMAMLAPGMTIGTIGAPWARIRPLTDFWR